MELETPTGCFKDRGSLIEVLKARELKADAICLASTGNMAASVAAYACFFKIPCYVFVPEFTSEAKLAQANMYNASIIRIKGDYSVCESLCRQFARSGKYYLAGDYVFREEGQKSFSYELVQQQDGPFDFILVPVGCGTNFAAIWKGLREAFDGGLIAQLPRMVAIQPEGSSPVVAGIMKKEKVVLKSVSTMAQAVAAADPVDFHKVLKGIEESDGLAFTVTEEQILEALREMSVEEAIFTEPACALPLAAVKNHPEVFGGRRCLLVLTGTGLKDTAVVARHTIPAPVLDPDVEKVIRFIETGFPEIQKQSWGKSRDTVLNNFKLDPDHEKLYQDYITRINKKGKTLSTREIDMLQSVVLNEQPDLTYPVSVLDYDITMKKNGLVTARLTLDVQGNTVKVAGKGVGPLDAALGTIRSESDRLYPVEVINHGVEIVNPDTNSLVVVSLTLRYDGSDYVVKGASTDVIEAGLNAFTKGLAVISKKRN
jgi:threonine synthase